MKANRSAKRLPCTAMRSIRDEVRPRKDRRGVDLISEVLPFGRLWYGEPEAGKCLGIGCSPRRRCGVPNTRWTVRTFCE